MQTIKKIDSNGTIFTGNKDTDQYKVTEIDEERNLIHVDAINWNHTTTIPLLEKDKTLLKEYYPEYFT